MEFYEEASESGAVIERSDDEGLGRTPDVAWVLAGSGLVAFIAVAAWQASSFAFSRGWIAMLMQVGYLLASAMTTAGLVLVGLRRWLIPEIVTAMREANRSAERVDEAGP